MLDRDIKALITILEESNIDEIEVSTFWGKQNIKLKKNSAKSVIKENVTSNEVETIKIDPISNSSDKKITTEVKDEKSEENQNSTIKAPLVGTFYLSPKPEEPPYVKVGDHVKKGDTLCIIEAMKIFNEIEAEVSGKIVEILIENATPVEFDQDLFVIIPE